jgi:dGTPase
MVGAAVAPRLQSPDIAADSFGHIVQAACLAHDIGNPPFGHSGEEAIREWFTRSRDWLAKNDIVLTKTQSADFASFEGNAQGFRILTHLEMYKDNGGLQLTYPVLGTFAKYPRASSVARDAAYPGGKKMGFFDAERPHFAEVAEGLGLIRRKKDRAYWCRHPLAFLVEAADDICYSIIDIEDGYGLGYLTFEAAMDVLGPIAGKSKTALAGMHEDDAVALCRALGINKTVEAVTSAFLANEDKILAGTFANSLVDETPYKDAMANAIVVAQRRIYWSERKTKLELAGAEVIGGLLDTFAEVAVALSAAGFKADELKGRAQSLARLMGRCLTRPKNGYEALLCVTDFVSGMTDRYAVDLYQTLTGISTDA